MQDHAQNARTLLSPKPAHLTNGSLSARKSRSRELVSATTIFQKCVQILGLLSHGGSKESYYRHFKEENDQLLTINYFIDHIYENVSRLMSKDSEGYEQIETQLQKQENLNRSLIKKELQFREEHKTLFDELADEKKRVLKLNEHISRLSDQLKEKDLTSLHFQNELRACQKELQILQGPFLKSFHKESPLLKNSQPKEPVSTPREFYGSRDMGSMLSREAEKSKVHKLGHKRRNSEEIPKKPSSAAKGDHQKKSIIYKK